MIPDPKICDRVTVRVTTGWAHEDDRKNTLRVHPPVPAVVVHVTNGGGFRNAPRFSVRLLADAAPGWYRGDTYRAGIEQLGRAEG